jgi:hypothetical protein
MTFIGTAAKCLGGWLRFSMTFIGTAAMGIGGWLRDLIGHTRHLSHDL